MENAKKILIVDDDQSHRIMLLRLISGWGYLVESAEDGETAINLCKNNYFDLVLMDIKMKKINGIEALAKIKNDNPKLLVLLMTAYASVETAIEALKAGAYDYLVKPFNFLDLKLTLKRSLEHATLCSENIALRTSLASSFENIIGESAIIHNLTKTISTIAPTDATVLITGESGTGKELVAKAIHAHSKRNKEPFIAINCAAISENLLESELFGHTKGAFTGADKKRDGKFLAANQGTIFLDEIGEIPLSMQAKLLRVLQEQEIQSVGSDNSTKINVRILAATNSNLAEDVASGKFRQDLYYRLNVISLELPPLNKRVEDIPLLVSHFLNYYSKKNNKQIKGFTLCAMEKLMQYSWPGNVRELKNVIERIVIFSTEEYANRSILPAEINNENTKKLSKQVIFSNMTLEEIEQYAVMEVLKEVDGNKSEAARRLGISRTTLRSKIEFSTEKHS